MDVFVEFDKYYSEYFNNLTSEKKSYTFLKVIMLLARVALGAGVATMIDESKSDKRNMITYFMMMLYPGITFFSSFFYYGNNFYLPLTLTIFVGAAVSTYPYFKIRTLV